jgi:hypothetical protein
MSARDRPVVDLAVHALDAYHVHVLAYLSTTRYARDLCFLYAYVGMRRFVCICACM